MEFRDRLYQLRRGRSISQEELAQIQRWEAELVQALRRAPIWKRLYARWILALA